jgi:hypothetical protein
MRGRNIFQDVEYILTYVDDTLLLTNENVKRHLVLWNYF